MTVPVGGTLLRRWAQFVRERFPVATHVAMVAAFVSGNAFVATGGAMPDNFRLLATGVVILLVFFRLRLFDELKDHDTDRTLHPERPLSRGLVSVIETRRALVLVVAVELILVATLGWSVVRTWIGVLAYSLLMYREFLIGPWLRPRMELYAVTHTFIAAPLGWLVASAVASHPPPMGHTASLALINWLLFTLFEFARKSHAPVEERPDVATYSSRWRPIGSAALCLSCLLPAIALGRAVTATTPVADALWAALAASGVGVAVGYAFRPLRRTAQLYRTTFALLLLLYYVVLTAAMLTSQLLTSQLKPV